MDPFSQGALGAAAAQSASQPRHTRLALLAGWLGGMAADIDVLIRSPHDPLLFLEYHRGFTHSLLFIPFGGAITGLLLYLLLRRRERPGQLIAFATFGYATHALLDACTTYGTQLLWPLSDTRFAWNNMSIIDPLFTLPIILLLIVASLRRQPALARIALAWALIYPGIGVLQRERAEAAGMAVALSRGHQPVDLKAKPGFANLLLWKIVYEYDGRFYIDGVRVGREVTHFPGQSIARLQPPQDFPWLDEDSQQAHDLRRFSWFSSGYVARDPANPYRVIDIRYSFLPNEIGGLWSIELAPGAAADHHAAYRTHRNSGGKPSRYWQMLVGD